MNAKVHLVKITVYAKMESTHIRVAVPLRTMVWTVNVSNDILTWLCPEHFKLFERFRDCAIE